MTEVALRETDDGVTLPVRAQPRARKNAILGVRQNAIRVAVTAPAEDGRANQAIIKLLSDKLSVPRRQVELLQGTRSRDKVFLIRGIDQQMVRQRLELPE